MLFIEVGNAKKPVAVIVDNLLVCNIIRRRRFCGVI
jgi:hypothetical protein